MHCSEYANSKLVVARAHAQRMWHLLLCIVRRTRHERNTQAGCNGCLRPSGIRCISCNVSTEEGSQKLAFLKFYVHEKLHLLSYIFSMIIIQMFQQKHWWFFEFYENGFWQLSPNLESGFATLYEWTAHLKCPYTRSACSINWRETVCVVLHKYNVLCNVHARQCLVNSTVAVWQVQAHLYITNGKPKVLKKPTFTTLTFTTTKPISTNTGL